MYYLVGFTADQPDKEIVWGLSLNFVIFNDGFQGIDSTWICIFNIENH